MVAQLSGILSDIYTILSNNRDKSAICNNLWFINQAAVRFVDVFVQHKELVVIFFMQQHKELVVIFIIQFDSLWSHM